MLERGGEASTRRISGASSREKSVDIPKRKREKATKKKTGSLVLSPPRHPAGGVDLPLGTCHGVHTLELSRDNFLFFRDTNDDNSNKSRTP